MKIKNINGIPDVDCKCDSWLDHWFKFSGQEPTYCPAAECMNIIAAGARVQKDIKGDNQWYVFPLCNKHDSMIGESLDVNDHIDFVSAEIGMTCGKGRKSIGN